MAELVIWSIPARGRHGGFRERRLRANLWPMNATERRSVLASVAFAGSVLVWKQWPATVVALVVGLALYAWHRRCLAREAS
jgi:hypothetical protein